MRLKQNKTNNLNLIILLNVFVEEKNKKLVGVTYDLSE
jgi:hypothetical protein